MYSQAWMQLTVASHIAEESRSNDPYHELNGYLKSPLEPFNSLPDVAVIQWWKDHSVIYPTVARMARDLLAVPGSSTASERQFF
jgi:hypothetical protein